MKFLKRIFKSDEQRDTGIPVSNSHLLLDADAGRLFHPLKTQQQSILSIPAVWCAIDFLSGTLAALPLKVYKEDDRTEVTGPALNLLGKTPAPARTSFDWRNAVWRSVFTQGRSITYISRAGNGSIRRLYWDIDPGSVSLQLNDSGDLHYHYTDATHGTKIWPANDVIDIAWMRSIDGLRHYSPLFVHQDIFLMAQKFHEYQMKFASTGGVPPWVLKARWGSDAAVKNAWRDLLSVIRTANKNNDMVIPISKDMEMQQLGISPEAGQIMQTQQFVVRQIARVYGLPPVYLHDLDRMTYSNAEHQGLNLTKYTLTRWAEQLEQQINLKVLGNGRVARHDMDGLLRGDYATRVQGHATAINSGQLTPNEARKKEDLKPHDHGDDLFMQSGTQPIEMIINGAEPNEPESGIQTGDD